MSSDGVCSKSPPRFVDNSWFWRHPTCELSMVAVDTVGWNNWRSGDQDEGER
jgi:hypothetical protein